MFTRFLVAIALVLASFTGVILAAELGGDIQAPTASEATSNDSVLCLCHNEQGVEVYRQYVSSHEVCVNLSRPPEYTCWTYH